MTAPDLYPLTLRFRFGGIHLGSVAFPSALKRPGTTEYDPTSRDLGTWPTSPDELDVVQFPSYPVQERLPRMTLLPGMIRYVPDQYRRYSIDMKGTFAEYMQKFSSKTRFTIKKKLRRFKEHSGDPIRWTTYRQPDEVAEFYRLARQVSATTYQERLLKAGLPATEEAQRSLRELAEADAFRGYILWHHDRPIAYLCCPIQDNVVSYDHVGYDPEFREWSPGVVLLVLVLEQLFAEQRFVVFDFTQGEGPHKELFANQFTECADIYFFKRSLSRLLVLLTHSSLEALSKSAGAALARIGLKKRVKELIRFRRIRVPATDHEPHPVQVLQPTES